MFDKYFLFASTLLCGANAIFGTMKNITVTGRLYCGFGIAREAIIELWEEDTVLGIGSDDKLNVTIIDYSGRFQIYGQKKEFTNIEPYILIKHQCDTSQCDITDRRDIPARYLGGTYDIGSLELTVGNRGRQKSCRFGYK
ncbi:hypothetical protein AB6A40_006586 [Gnathostoma spinigerum]|uniref:Transthyretin-like family protein n=1 Tax=Gnathostoma spinigerum TaxID=75299 RepID=A0ABD6ET67_9BILA